jgi:hypothetical protein
VLRAAASWRRGHRDSDGWIRRALAARERAAAARAAAQAAGRPAHTRTCATCCREGARASGVGATCWRLRGTEAACAGALGLAREGTVVGLLVGHAERGALWVVAPQEWPGGPGRQGHDVGCASAQEWAGHAARWAGGGGGGREGELGLFYFLILIIFFYSYSYLYTRKSYKLNGYTPRQYVKHKINALQHEHL